MSAALHALGLPDTRSYLLAASLAAIWLALGTNLIGMKLGKWTEHIGGLAVWRSAHFLSREADCGTTAAIGSACLVYRRGRR
jgi:hypothetical protein